MKKQRTILLILSVLVTALLISAPSDAITNNLKDIKESDWFASTVNKLVDLGGINGYPDGSFKPNNQITKAEFIKVLVASIRHDNILPSGSHWASGYVDKAIEIGLAEENDFDNLNVAITRMEMAMLVSNSLDYKEEIQVVDRDDYRALITDYNNIPIEYQDFVLKAFTKGIITGYSDGSFGAERSLTRAEASTVVVRVLDKSDRKVPELPVSGPYVDLRTVSLTSNLAIGTFKPGEDKNNRDFGIIIGMWEPLEPQYNDVENILRARFGSVKEISEIMDYIKEKKVIADEIEDKWWTVNEQRVYVGSSQNSQRIDIISWYK